MCPRLRTLQTIYLLASTFEHEMNILVCIAARARFRGFQGFISFPGAKISIIIAECRTKMVGRRSDNLPHVHSRYGQLGLYRAYPTKISHSSLSYPTRPWVLNLSLTASHFSPEIPTISSQIKRLTKSRNLNCWKI